MVSRILTVVMIAAVTVAGMLATNYFYYTFIITSPTRLLMPTDAASLNWAGYAVAYNLSNPQPLVTEVSVSWIVPKVEISQINTFSVIWVGIGGLFGHSLIQTGTEQDCINGTTYYFAWYELLPNYSVAITTINVSAGDTITASIILANSTDDLWSVSIGDVSTGQRFDQTFQYSSSRLSAEWVVERPDINNQLNPLADFGNVTLSNCEVTIDKVADTLGYFHSTRMFMYDMKGTRLADVSDFSGDGSSFTVEYLASQ